MKKLFCDFTILIYQIKWINCKEFIVIDMIHKKGSVLYTVQTEQSSKIKQIRNSWF